MVKEWSDSGIGEELVFSFVHCFEVFWCVVVVSEAVECAVDDVEEEFVRW